MKVPLFILPVICLLFLFSCKPKTTESPEYNPTIENPEVKTPVDKPQVKLPASIPPPEGYDLLKEADGDLDNDGIPEKVIVYNTPVETDFGTARQVLIFKLKENNWEEWQVIDGGVLPSEHGGMMGDPFQSVSIQRGSIVFEHFGGSRWKWNYTHRFRFQNNAWELIGATIINGAPCEYFEEYDYNLSIGKINYQKETESCDDAGNKKETKTEIAEFNQKPASLPEMAGFYPGENELSIENTDKIFYY